MFKCILMPLTLCLHLRKACKGYICILLYLQTYIIIILNVRKLMLIFLKPTYHANCVNQSHTNGIPLTFCNNMYSHCCRGVTIAVDPSDCGSIQYQCTTLYVRLNVFFGHFRCVLLLSLLYQYS